jgi:hypothetical protein
LGEISHDDLSSKSFDGVRIDNLIIVIMEALQNGRGFSSTIVAKKLLHFWG